MGLSLSRVGIMRVVGVMGVGRVTVVPLVRKRIRALVSPHGLQGEEHTQQEEQETAPHGQARIFAQPRALVSSPARMLGLANLSKPGAPRCRRAPR